MSILTNLPVTSVCGTPEVVTIDKAQFVTDFAIIDPYWSIPANWQEIEFYYVDDTGPSQVKKMTFAGNTYSLNLKTNIYNGNMLCQKITIMDGNGAVLAFARASFPSATEFDFALVGGYGEIIIPNFNSLQMDSIITLANADLTANKLYSDTTTTRLVYVKPSLSSLNGKKYIEYVINSNLYNNSIFFGGSISDLSPTEFINSLDPYVFGLITNFSFSPAGSSYGKNGQPSQSSIDYQTGDILTIALDLDNKKVWLGKNGAWFAGEDPLTNLGGRDLSSFSGSDIYLGVGFRTQEAQVSISSSPVYMLTGFTYVGG